MSDCFAATYDGKVLVTTNSGSLWTTQSTAATGGLFALSCPDKTHCFAAGTSPVAGQGVLVVSTANGGARWSTVYSQALPPNVSQMITAGISCPTLQACWMTAGLFANGAAGVRTDLLIATTDGGSSWHDQSFPPPAPAATFFPASVSCATTLDCVVVGTTSVPEIASTHDGGNTWAFDLPTVYGGTTASSDVANTLVSLNGVSCADAQHCYAVGEPGDRNSNHFVAATTDGGTTWTIQDVGRTNSDRIVALNAVACPTTTACWAAGEAWSSANSVDEGVVVNTYNGGVADPSLTRISPATGPVSGGTSVSLTGSGFSNGTAEVYFGGVLATNVTVVSDTNITAVSPPGSSTGPVDVTVHTSRGVTPVLPRNVFTYTTG